MRQANRAAVDQAFAEAAKYSPGGNYNPLGLGGWNRRTYADLDVSKPVPQSRPKRRSCGNNASALLRRVAHRALRKPRADGSHRWSAEEQQLAQRALEDYATGRIQTAHACARAAGVLKPPSAVAVAKKAIDVLSDSEWEELRSSREISELPPYGSVEFAEALREWISFYGQRAVLDRRAFTELLKVAITGDVPAILGFGTDHEFLLSCGLNGDAIEELVR